LITHDGHDQSDVKFEYRSLDIVVFENDKQTIGIEVKASRQKGEKLKSEMLKLLPQPTMPSNDRGNDPIRKIKCLLDIKPREFRIVSPSKVWRFRVDYPDVGQLVLNEIDEPTLR
jgi:hypothetical protein